MARAILVSFLVVIGSSVGAGCGSSSQESSEKEPRPVTAIELQRVTPAGARLYTGSVESWNKENLAFEVSGRIDRVVDSGTEVQGARRDLEGKQVEPGSVLAAIDSSRYELQLEAAQAQYDSTTQKVEALKIEGDKVMQQQLRAAKAKRDRARSHASRMRRSSQSSSISATELEEAETAEETAEANVEQAEASIHAKRAELKSAQAELRRLETAVKQARLDLNHCELEAPFDGRVAAVHLVRGSLAEAGHPVLTLVMMDPLKIELAVSAEMHERIRVGDFVDVQLPTGAGGVQSSQRHRSGLSNIAWVHEKGTVADPATRTFKIRVMLRNQKFETPSPPDVPDELVRIEEVSSLQPLNPAAPETLYLDQRALYGNREEGHYVWHISDRSKEQTRERFEPLRRLKRVPVQLGEERLDLPAGYVLFELAESGGLAADDLLAVGVPEDYEEDGPVLLARRQWRFRPGELVSVGLEGSRSKTGFYVPMMSIIEEGGSHFVYLVDQQDHARRVKVRQGENAGTWRSIESSRLSAGDRVVVKGAQLLAAEGESVRVIEVEPPLPSGSTARPPAATKEGRFEPP